MARNKPVSPIDIDLYLVVRPPAAASDQTAARTDFCQANRCHLFDGIL